MKTSEALEMMRKIEKYYWGKIMDETIPKGEWIDFAIAVDKAIESLAKENAQRAKRSSA